MKLDNGSTISLVVGKATVTKVVGKEEPANADESEPRTPSS